MKKLLFLIPLFMLACSNPKKEQIEKLSDEVIELHDEMMPLMDDLYKLRMELQKAQGDSLEVASAIGEIMLAEEAMMNWMANFNPVYEGKTHDETINYLEGQRVTMQSVANQMNGSIARAKDLLNN